MKMLVARQYHIYAAAREGIHCKVRAANDTVAAFQIQPFERMMRDNYAGNVISNMRKSFRRRNKLADVDPAVLDRQGSCRVDPDHSYFAINVEWVCVCIDIAPVARQRRHRAREDIPQRHIVIAGHHDTRAGKGIEKGPRLQEFVFPGALRQVPRHDQQIRVNATNLGGDRVHKPALRFSEVQVRKMDEGLH